MTHHNDTNSVERPRTLPLHTPRLRLKPKAPVAGLVDGAWWPRTDDLAVELPDLLAVLSVRLGPIDRVLYNLGEWVKAPAKLTGGERSVHLDGYRNQPANTIEVIGLNRDALVLLALSPDTDPQSAHTAMMAAAGRDNVSTVEQLLPRSQPNTIPPAATVAEQGCWESEGGAASHRLTPAGARGHVS